METYSTYDYSVYENWPDCHRMTNLGWCYSIYRKGKVIAEAIEWFETKQRAVLAAIGHITLLERGEDYVYQ